MKVTHPLSASSTQTYVGARYLHDFEVENTVMDSLVESWRGNNDPDSEIDLLICQLRDQYVASGTRDWYGQASV